jgi:hypothetical protein
MNLFYEQEQEEKENRLRQQQEDFRSKFPNNRDIHYRINFKANGISGLYYYRMIKTQFHNYMLQTSKVLEIYQKLTYKLIPVDNDLKISTKTVREHHPFTYNRLCEKYELIAIGHNLGWNNNIYKSEKLF